MWGFLGGKRAKNDLKLPISVCFDHISGVVDQIEILIMISTGVFLYSF